MGFRCSQLRYIKCQFWYMSHSVHDRSTSVHVNLGTFSYDDRYPSCCVLDLQHSPADLLLLKAYVEERSRRVLFILCCRRYSFQYLCCYACCLTYK